MRLIECVPNFSEGRNKNIINSITEQIKGVENVSLLDVDPGFATNRTVVTFVGEPEAVCEAAFRAVKRASELIDMRHHTGAHPRMGATDVLPLIPIAGVTLEECAEMARGLAKRIAEELDIPTYNYEAAASSPERQNLAKVRAGEYEGLKDKLADPKWKPDFGKAEWSDHVARTGSTIVGARDFLVATNFNLNTTSTRRANAIAFDVRENGRSIDLGEWTDASGAWERKPAAESKPTGVKTTIPGTLKGCKAIGWFIEEYGIAQVSMNITNISQTSLHEAYEEVKRAAEARGVSVTGTEIVGLIPLRVLTEAGKHFLRKQRRSVGVSEAELIKIAIHSMGLSEISPFNPAEKVIEYMIEDKTTKKLMDLTCREFTEVTASESAAPGGGSVSAYMGSLGAALGTMVANLSSHLVAMEENWEYFSEIADKGQDITRRLLLLVDEDTASYNRIIESARMPKSTDEEKAARAAAIQAATLYAMEVPLRTMQTSMEAFDVIEAMVSKGNPNSVTDAGVGALAIRAAVIGAGMNVRINAGDLKDRAKAEALVSEAKRLVEEANKREAAIITRVNEMIDK